MSCRGLSLTGEGLGGSAGDFGLGPSGFNKLLPASVGEADSAALGCRFGVKIVTWLILPVVICLSQRLSHACLSISNYTVKLRMAH